MSRRTPEGFVPGRVGGSLVACISAEVQILCHLGYDPTEKDVRDVLQLCRAFGLSIPKAYKAARRSGRGLTA